MPARLRSGAVPPLDMAEAVHRALKEIAEAAGCCKASASAIRRGKGAPHVSTWSKLTILAESTPLPYGDSVQRCSQIFSLTSDNLGARREPARHVRQHRRAASASRTPSPPTPKGSDCQARRTASESQGSSFRARQKVASRASRWSTARGGTTHFGTVGGQQLAPGRHPAGVAARRHRQFFLS